ncbi:ERMES complex subunit mmm1 [Malassezia nana]|uniref:Maintenance of mitochondrial morphology protein 1 n=1 Tax=Malassezia nana TaxID=180528 RepID=A0AAF0ELY6_9BASI|nr:ERMES complex subunit mmm1 [Malassezia nana]
MASATLPPGSVAFIQGFVAGQLVLVITLLLLFRYFFIETKPATFEQRRTALRERTRMIQASLDARCPSMSSAQTRMRVPYEQGSQACLLDMLHRLHFELPMHNPETLTWLNVLLAQLCLHYRQSLLQKSNDKAWEDAEQLPSTVSAEKAAVKRLLERTLTAAMASHTNDWLGTITVTDVDMGTGYPVLSNARIRPSNDPRCLRLEMDLDYKDLLCVGLDTQLQVRVPPWHLGTLAVALSLRVERLAGTIAVEIGPGGTEQDPLADLELRVCMYPDFVLDAHVSTVLGSKSKLHDVPKMEELLLAQLRLLIQRRLVWPEFWRMPLPRMEHDRA